LHGYLCLTGQTENKFTVQAEPLDPEIRNRRSTNRSRILTVERTMAKLKHETELVKAAIVAGVKYAEDRGAAVFEPRDSASEKILYIYRLLVHDKVIQPLPEDKVSQQTMRHKLAIWYSKRLPIDDPLLK